MSLSLILYKDIQRILGAVMNVCFSVFFFAGLRLLLALIVSFYDFLFQDVGQFAPSNGLLHGFLTWQQRIPPSGPGIYGIWSFAWHGPYNYNVYHISTIETRQRHPRRILQFIHLITMMKNARQKQFWMGSLIAWACVKPTTARGKISMHSRIT